MRRMTYLAIVLLSLVATLPQRAARAAGEGPLQISYFEGAIDPMGSRLRAVGLAYRQQAGIPFSTRLRTAYDNDGLSVSFESEDTRLSASIQEDWVDLGSEDVVFVDVWSPASGRHLRVQASPLGHRSARWISADGEPEASAPDGADAIRVETRVFGAESFGVPGKPNQENVEAAATSIFIPFALLETSKPAPGDRWRMNFTRIDYDSGRPAIWSWREEFGEVEFK